MRQIKISIWNICDRDPCIIVISVRVLSWLSWLHAFCMYGKRKFLIEADLPSISLLKIVCSISASSSSQGLSQPSTQTTQYLRADTPNNATPITSKS